MTENHGLEIIPTSARMFRLSGASQRFADWLETVRGDLHRARCEEIAWAAGQALDVLGQALPHLILNDPATAESFLDKLDLTVLGVASHRRSKLKRAIRGLYAWENDLDGATTRHLMDGGVVPGSSVPPRRPAAGSPPPAPAGPIDMTAARKSQGQGSAPAFDRGVAETAEMPLSFGLLETAVACELDRQRAAGEAISVMAAGREVLARHRADSRRRIAVAVADVCNVPVSAFVRDGAASTNACDTFLLRLLALRRLDGRRRTAAG